MRNLCGCGMCVLVQRGDIWGLVNRKKWESGFWVGVLGAWDE